MKLIFLILIFSLCVAYLAYSRGQKHGIELGKEIAITQDVTEAYHAGYAEAQKVCLQWRLPNSKQR